MSFTSMDDLEKKVAALAEFLNVEFKGFAAVKKKKESDCFKCKNYNTPGYGYGFLKDNHFEPVKPKEVRKCASCKYNGTINPFCIPCTNYSLWKPVEVPKCEKCRCFTNCNLAKNITSPPWWCFSPERRKAERRKS